MYGIYILQRNGGGPSSKAELYTLWLDLVTFYRRLKRDDAAQETNTVNVLLHTLTMRVYLPACILTHFLDSVQMNKEYPRPTQSLDIDFILRGHGLARRSPRDAL